MAWTLCTSGSMISKAGVGANSDIIISGAILADWNEKIEGNIVARTRLDFVSGAAINDHVVNAASELASDLGAIKIINYDMKGYTSRAEALTMLNVLTDNSNRLFQELKDFEANNIKDP